MKLKVSALLMLLFCVTACMTNTPDDVPTPIYTDTPTVFDQDSFDGASYTLEGASYISERILFPATINGNKLILEMSVDRPADKGQYPVLILTHGRHGPFPEKRSVYVSRYFERIKWGFLKKHLIVVQLARRGEGLSEGSNMDEYKMTPLESGNEMVKDIEQALIYMRSKPYVDKNKFVIGGHSQGGWAALAAASANLEGVTCIINFSGATNYRRRSWSQDGFRKASIDFTRDCKILAQTAKVPSLWIYGDSDPLQVKSDIEMMYSAYTESGGKAELILLPNIGHKTMRDDAPQLWAESVRDFLVKNKVIATSEGSSQ